MSSIPWSIKKHALRRRKLGMGRREYQQWLQQQSTTEAKSNDVAPEKLRGNYLVTIAGEKYKAKELVVQ